jgi:hypothetical protein
MINKKHAQFEELTFGQLEALVRLVEKKLSLGRLTEAQLLYKNRFNGAAATFRDYINTFYGGASSKPQRDALIERLDKLRGDLIVIIVNHKTKNR